MSVLKTYQSATGVLYNILLGKRDGKQIAVEFRGSMAEFSTSDAEVQSLLEDTEYYKQKKIFIVYENESKDEDTPKLSPITYTNVEDFQSAVEVLVKEYNVNESDIKTPNKLGKVAKEKGVSFPNLKV